MNNLEGFPQAEIPISESVIERDLSKAEPIFANIYEDRLHEEEILSQFTPEQVRDIRKKQRVLSSLAYFVGKDFDIPVLLNEPGQGWLWNQKHNHIKVDPKDLLEKPLDYLRFVICHEAGHRRISRILGVIPPEVWKLPGFPFMMNAVEDCRDNNFVAEAYPRFKKQMIFSYDLMQAETEARKAAQEELGHVPKSMQAGFEYMDQWLREAKDMPFEIDAALPQDVKDVVTKTLESAQDLWWRYPSKKEADSGEDTIHEYAKLSYSIAYERIWPEYKKLIDDDIREQELGQTAKDMGGQGTPQEGSKPDVPPKLSGSLTPQEKEELEKALEKALEAPPGEKEGSETKGHPIDVGSLSPELKEKIRAYLDSLPEDKKKEIHECAKKAIQEYHEKLAEDMQSKLNQQEKIGEEKTEGDMPLGDSKPPEDTSSLPSKEGELKKVQDAFDLRAYQQRLERLVRKDKNTYESYEKDLLPLIEKLENELREILVSHSASAWKGGFRTGKRIDVQKRIQEKARSISAMESRSWQKRERPDEQEYAIQLVVDLSGSMRQEERIKETFKAVVVLAETLNRLGIKTGIFGFNDEIYEYLQFGESLSAEAREHMGGMFKEVDDSCCTGCGNEHSETDIGWATETAIERLTKEKADRKVLVTLSDARRAESERHPAGRYDYEGALDKAKQSGVELIGLGVGQGTWQIQDFFPINIADASVEQFVDAFPGLIKQAIAGTHEA